MAGIRIDTPAGRQLAWLLEQRGSSEVAELLEHVDPSALSMGPFRFTPDGYLTLLRTLDDWLGPARVSSVLDTRSRSPFELEVVYRADDGTTWTRSVRLAEEPPHRIVDMQLSIADDAAPEAAGPDRPLVRCVDHFYVGVSDPRPGLDVLATELGLPVVFPLNTYANGLAHAVLELGNVQIELVDAAEVPPRTPARVQGIAFEPPPLSDDLIAEIDRRGLAHAPPLATPFFTNIWFGGFISDPDATVFFCRYHHPRLRDRAARLTALDAVGGGELGLTGVVELVVGTRTWDELVARWQRFLDPIRPVDPGHWRIGDGPAVRIVEADDDAVLEVVLGVRSVEEAIRRVRELGLGTVAPASDGMFLDLPSLNGLVIRLVQT